MTRRKWTVWEGGIRVPAIIRWPGVAPMGGDEINVLHAGHNYGWPLVALGENMAVIV